MTSEPTAQDVVESVIEIDDPGGKLGVAPAAAAAMLADPTRVRALLGDTAAQALLLSATRTLKEDEGS